MLAGKTEGASSILVMEEREPKQRMVAFNKSNIMAAKTDKLTSMIGMLSVQHSQSKTFIPRVYQDRGQPLAKSGRGDQYYNTNRNIRSIRYNGNNQNHRGRNNFKDNRSRGDTRILKETGHMTEEEMGTQMLEEGLGEEVNMD